MAHKLDTNILLRFTNIADPQHAFVRQALTQLDFRNERLYYTSQNLVEFWSVATRPVTSANGLGLSIADADAAVRVIENTFFLLPDHERVLTEWRRLVVTYGVAGRQVHDARLVAYMLVHDVSHLLTLNVGDFARYEQGEGIVAVHPSTVV